jgi:flagellar hook-associated protein 2
MVSIVSTLGVGSGIDTKALIDSLVTADREARAKPLTARSDALTARVSALGQVRSALQGIASSLSARVTGGAIGVVPASSDSAIGVERRGNGPPTAFSAAVSVTAVAAGQRLVAAPLASAAAAVGEGVLTISFGRRTELAGGDFSFASGAAPSIDVAITATNNSLAGLRDAINAAGNAAGVSASIINNAGAATLAIRGADGAENAFVISAAETPGRPGLGRFAHLPGTSPMVATARAADAEFTLDGISVTRASNIIDDLVPGVRLRLARPVAAAMLIGARDGSALATTVSDFASTLSAMRGLLADFRKGASGNDPAGALAGDATARTIDQRLSALIATPVAAANGLRLRDLGVSISRSGSITFDVDRLAALPPARQGDAEALLRTLSGSASSAPLALNAIAEAVAPASAGLTRRKDAITADLARLEIRLSDYRTTLTRQYAAMDRLVAASKAVGTQLDTQIKIWTNGRN